MRLSFITLFVSFLSLTVSVATNPYPLARRDRKHSPASSVVFSRQYHVPRSLLDLCINTNVNLFADVEPLLELLGRLGLLSNVHLCLCLKDLDIYLATNAEVQSLIQLLGSNAIGSRISAIINTSPDARKCTFPQHAHHSCNTQDPCHWACDRNYVRDGDQCVCAPPFTSCNGVCGSFSKGCPSAVPRSLNARTQSVLTLSQAKASCKLHETVCGIPGHKDSLAFECIDTTVTKDSCGGCVVPHPFPQLTLDHEVYGQDCTKIPNVRHVACSHSHCIVTSCQEGWIPSVNNTCMVDLTQAPGRVLKRSNLSINATTTAVVDSEALSKLVVVVDTVLHLGVPAPDASVSSTTLYGVSLLNDINNAAASLVTSPTIRNFLQNIDHLLDVSSLLKSWMSSCGCVDKLGPSGIAEAVELLVDSVAELRTFCLDYPFVLSPEDHLALPPSTKLPPDHALVIRPSDISAGLRLKGEISIFTQRPNDTNNLLSVLGLWPAGNSSQTPTIDPVLTDNISALVYLVGNLSALPLVGHPSPVDVDLSLISQATISLLNATRVPDFLAALDRLVDLLDAGVHTLDDCGCIDSLELQQVYTYLKHVLAVALESLAWCHNHPGSITSYETGDNALVVGLSDLLGRLSISFDATPTIAVLGGVNDAANGLLESLGIGSNIIKQSLVLKFNARGLTHWDSSKTIHRSIVSPPSTSSRSVRIITSTRRPTSTTTRHLFTSGSEGSSYRPTVIRVSPTAAPNTGASSPDDKNIRGLNLHLSTLGLGEDITRERVERDLNEPIVGHSDDFHIRQLDLRRHRDVVHSTSTLNIELQGEVDALIDLFITLVAKCVTNCAGLGTPRKNFLDASLQSVVGLLTATNWSTFVGGLDSLTTASVDALKLLDNCGCVTDRKLEAVYATLMKIVDGSLALQKLCRQGMKKMKSGLDGRPVVVGLTRLMKALAIEGRNVVLLNGVGSASLSRLIDELSDLGVGPAAEQT